MGPMMTGWVFLAFFGAGAAVQRYVPAGSRKPWIMAACGLVVGLLSSWSGALWHVP